MPRRRSQKSAHCSYAFFRPGHAPFEAPWRPPTEPPWPQSRPPGGLPASTAHAAAAAPPRRAALDPGRGGKSKPSTCAHGGAKEWGGRKACKRGVGAVQGAQFLLIACKRTFYMSHSCNTLHDHVNHLIAIYMAHVNHLHDHVNHLHDHVNHLHGACKSFIYMIM